MKKELLDQIVSIMDDCQDLTIATVRPDGYPQATTVSYANDGLTIYFGTTMDSQKAKNIAKNNKVSITINRNYKTWDEIVGLSMAAFATPVLDPNEQAKVGLLFLKKFPKIFEYIEKDEVGMLYQVDPQVISVLDYTKGFGHTELVKV